MRAGVIDTGIAVGSLADGFAAAMTQELGARFHTTDSELVRQLRGTRLAISRY